MFESEDVPQLSAETFLALQEFYNEQNTKELALETNTDVTLDEDWQLSQFWYNEDTITSLVKIALNQAKSNPKIALISCPTLYNELKRKCKDVKLFEFDGRFAKVCGADFVQYDYKYPLEVPKHLTDSFDLVIADPPFLSEECLTKTAITIRLLTNKDVILCTGAVMADLAKRLLAVQQTSFIPEHRNNLGNDFCCFTNFNIDDLV
ncbi:hypothetical protein FQA39_LY12620 [Lamprigera yunnana]|nr:hypothetical protein FQA39_LY12620 [Lamprigera yunnana]